MCRLRATVPWRRFRLLTEPLAAPAAVAVTAVALLALGGDADPPDLPLGLQTTEYRVVHALVYPAEMAGGLSLAVHEPGTPETQVVRDPVALWGTRQECRVTLDGQPATREQLLRWLPTVRFPRVTIVRDMDRYGLVVAARFTDPRRKSQSPQGLSHGTSRTRPRPPL